MKDVTGVLEVRGSCLVQKQKDWMYSAYICICSDGDINPCLGKQWLLCLIVHWGRGLVALVKWYPNLVDFLEPR